MPDSRIPPIVYLILLIACLCIYGIILDPRLTFAGMDFVNLNYPRVLLARNAYASGLLPLWNWYEWGGSPLLAALQGAVFYPPTWLAMLCPLPYGLQLFVFLHLYTAGVGVCILARKLLDLPVWAAVLAAILYMGNSFFVGRIEQFQIMAVNCLLPWLVLTMIRTINNCRYGMGLAAVWLLTLLAGHPQYAILNLLGSLAFCMGIILWKPSLPRSRWKTIICLTGWIALGTAGAAAQLLPTWELGQLSERIWPYPEPTLPELTWANLPALVIPHFYNIITGETGRVFGFTELGLYAGLLALPLAIAGVVTGWHNGGVQRQLTTSAFCVWLLAMAFALGKNGFIAPLVFDYMPFFKQSRGAARSLNIAGLMLALMAGIGSLALWKTVSTRMGRPAVLSWGLCILFCADLSYQHFGELGSILTPLQALNVRPLMSAQQIHEWAPGSRLYRFMGSDSDLYLNNSAGAVAERLLRLQPNLGSVEKTAVLDGYEEGLLPGRSRANLFRSFNRNLRNDSPDASLLAFMGSSLMLTEFPLQDGPNWKLLGQPLIRPAIVPPIAGEPAAYRYLESPYKVQSLVLNFDRIGDKKLLERCQAAFPVNSPKKTQTKSEWTHHPLESIAPETFRSAQVSADAVHQGWNRYSFEVPSGSHSILFLTPPYPGWKLEEKNFSHDRLKSLCSLFYLLEIEHGLRDPRSVTLIFAPFSLRIGLFVSLLMLSILALLIPTRIHSIKINKSRN